MSEKHRVAHINDLEDGQLKQVDIDDDRQVLLARVDGEYKVFAASCPHHGAPMAEGLLQDGKLTCPWHMAEYDARTGQLDQPPSLDSLPSFEVLVEGEEVFAMLPETLPGHCHVPMVGRDPDNTTSVVILGTGAAGLTAAETLRQDGFTGRIRLLTREPHRPYDRTDLSKMYLAGKKESAPFLRGETFYKDHDIELITDCTVTHLNASNRTLTCSHCDDMKYDRLLLAPGSRPRKLGVEGETLNGVVTLRSLDDAKHLRELAGNNERAVVIGASFIGMEVAASLRKHDVEIDLVAPEKVPFVQVLGEQIGKMYQDKHESKGVRFHLGRTVQRFQGDETLRQVVLDDGRELDADFAVVGVGVRPETDFLDDIETNEDGSVDVDEHLQVCDGVWAAGDIARFVDPRSGDRSRIEHWRVAMQQGRVAAHNIAGREVPYTHLPFFWTNQYFLIVDYLGHASQWDDVVIDGEIDDQSFVAYFQGSGTVRAVATAGRSKATDRLLHVLHDNPQASVEALRQAIESL